jgi:hypothetical protein
MLNNEIDAEDDSYVFAINDFIPDVPVLINDNIVNNCDHDIVISIISPNNSAKGTLTLTDDDSKLSYKASMEGGLDQFKYRATIGLDFSEA